MGTHRRAVTLQAQGTPRGNPLASAPPQAPTCTSRLSSPLPAAASSWRTSAGWNCGCRGTSAGPADSTSSSSRCGRQGGATERSRGVGAALGKAQAAAISTDAPPSPPASYPCPCADPPLAASAPPPPRLLTAERRCLQCPPHPPRLRKRSHIPPSSPGQTPAPGPASGAPPAAPRRHPARCPAGRPPAQQSCAAPASGLAAGPAGAQQPCVGRRSACKLLSAREQAPALTQAPAPSATAARMTAG